MHLEERGGTGGCFLKEFTGTLALRFKRKYSRSKSNTLIRKKMLHLCSNFPSKYEEMKGGSNLLHCICFKNVYTEVLFS